MLKCNNLKLGKNVNIFEFKYGNKKELRILSSRRSFQLILVFLSIVLIAMVLLFLCSPTRVYFVIRRVLQLHREKCLYLQELISTSVSADRRKLCYLLRVECSVTFYTLGALLKIATLFYRSNF